ncbi:MAG: SDR family oxidoreductase [Actinomycetota bacterium]|nr:SDR family oxidoreductase [Actinomycetota bacterium]
MAERSPLIPVDRPIALVTGASRRIGIGAAVARRLASDGWDLATTQWSSYDARMPWGSDPTEVVELHRDLHDAGARSVSIEADLLSTDSPGEIFDFIEQRLGPVSALILAHCESVDSNIVDTTIEAFDRHFAVNARATWLLIRELAQRGAAVAGRGRIVGLTSDHTAGNLPYGASKGALDRIILASASELAHLGITANVVNPGATDTGWMTPELQSQVAATTPLGRVGLPADCANLVSFLCSKAGGWINGQLIYSNGGQQ